MVVADLHVHTTASDGQLALADLPAAAARADLDVVAVTDHDRPHPDIDGPVLEREDLTIVHGIELRVDLAGQPVDLLGYGLSPTAALRERCARLQRDRRARARAIVDCLEDRLGVTVPVDLAAGVGRPDIARAVADVTHYDVQGVFDAFIADGGPCYVPREVPTFAEGRRLLAEAAAVVGLAHPLRYDDPAAALARCDRLDAVELAYPYDPPVDTGPVERAIERHDLLVTGGSDAHDDALGIAGLAETETAAFLAALESRAV